MNRHSSSPRSSASKNPHNHHHPRHTSPQSKHTHTSNTLNNEPSTPYDQPTRHARRGAVSHSLNTSLNASVNESKHSQHSHHHDLGKGGKEPRRHSPITLVYDLHDEFGPAERSVCGYATRRPNPRNCPDDDDDDISPRGTTRGERSKPGMRREPVLRVGSEQRFISGGFEAEGEAGSGSGYGRRGGRGERGNGERRGGRDGSKRKGSEDSWRIL